jgi:DNA-binding transcriptional regulator YiaG
MARGKSKKSFPQRAAGNADRALGLRIRTRRKEIGMTQSALAEALGVSFQQVQNTRGVGIGSASRD